MVRRASDIPLTMKNDIEKYLQEMNWSEQEIPDPTLLERMIRKRKEG
jgi:hypothetical protein